MIIQCPRCSTRWRAQDASDSVNPTFKCGKCHHTFRLFPGATDADERATPARKGAPPGAPSDNLEFIFPHRQPPAPPAAKVSVESTAAATTDAAATARAETVTTEIAKPAAAPAQAERLAVDSSSSVSPADYAARADDADRAPWDDAAPDEPPPVVVPRADLPKSPDDYTVGDVHDEGADDDDYVLGDPDAEIESPSAHAAPAASAACDATADANDEPIETEPDDPLLADLDESIVEATDLDLHDDDEFGDDDADDLTIDGDDRRQEPAPDTGRVLHLEETMSTPTTISAFSPICRSFATLVAIFAFLAIVMRADPEQAATWLAHVPLLGRTLGADHGIVHHIKLRNVEGGYQRLHNTRRVFVISGEAVNNSPETLERIEVAGALYDEHGRIEQKVVSTGNRTTVKLAELSEPEISYLQKFSSRLTLAPGQSTRFSIVFLEPPRGVREFSSSVVSARPTNRASARRQPDRAPNPAAVG